MRVLVTGANGFIGKNLLVHLREMGIETIPFTHEMTLQDLTASLNDVDLVFHLAGVNRPEEVAEFTAGNVGLTRQLCDLIRASLLTCAGWCRSSGVPDDGIGVLDRFY